MSASVIAWDIETVPDLRGFAAANGHDGKSDDIGRIIRAVGHDDRYRLARGTQLARDEQQNRSRGAVDYWLGRRHGFEIQFHCFEPGAYR